MHPFALMPCRGGQMVLLPNAVVLWIPGLNFVRLWEGWKDGQSAGESDHWLHDPVCAIWCKFLAEDPETDAWLVDLFEDDGHAARVLLTAGKVGVLSVFLASLCSLLDHTRAKGQSARQWLHPSRPWDLLAQTMMESSHAFCCAFFLVVPEPPQKGAIFVHSVLCEPVEMELKISRGVYLSLSLHLLKCVCKLRLKVEISSPSLAPSAMESQFTSSTPWIVRQRRCSWVFLAPFVSFCLLSAILQVWWLFFLLSAFLLPLFASTVFRIYFRVLISILPWHLSSISA